MVNSSQRKSFNSQRKLAARFVKSGDLVFDIGANIGNRTEIFLSLGASVVAFEPQPKCAKEVAARGNRRLTVVETAIGESEGSAQLYLQNRHVLASLVPGWETTVNHSATLTVSVTTLDRAIEKFGVPEFCKIDVEGFEPQVLKGLSQKLPALSLEYHCDERGVAQVNECLRRLAQLGEYRLNLVGQENALFLLPDWLTISEFAGAFPRCAAGNFWGDLFAVLTDHRGIGVLAVP